MGSYTIRMGMFLVLFAALTACKEDSGPSVGTANDGKQVQSRVPFDAGLGTASGDYVPPTPAQRGIADAALKFRLQARVSIKNALEAYCSQSTLKLAWPPTINSDPRWSVIVGSCVLTPLNASTDSPIFAYYNPYFDFLMLTVWEIVGDQPTITSMCLTTGGILLDHHTSDPLWTKYKNVILPLRFSKACQEVVIVLHKKYPRAINQRPPRLPTPDLAQFAETMEKGAALMKKTWARLSERDSSREQIALFMRVLRRADVSELGGLLASDSPFKPSAVAAVSPIVRANQEVKFVLEDASTGTFHILTSDSVFVDILFYVQLQRDRVLRLIGPFSLSANYDPLFQEISKQTSK